MTRGRRGDQRTWRAGRGRGRTDRGWRMRMARKPAATKRRRRRGVMRTRRMRTVNEDDEENTYTRKRNNHLYIFRLFILLLR